MNEEFIELSSSGPKVESARTVVADGFNSAQSLLRQILAQFFISVGLKDRAAELRDRNYEGTLFARAVDLPNQNIQIELSSMKPGDWWDVEGIASDHVKQGLDACFDFIPRELDEKLVAYRDGESYRSSPFFNKYVRAVSTFVPKNLKKAQTKTITIPPIGGGSAPVSVDVPLSDQPASQDEQEKQTVNQTLDDNNPADRKKKVITDLTSLEIVIQKVAESVYGVSLKPENLNDIATKVIGLVGDHVSDNTTDVIETMLGTKTASSQDSLISFLRGWGSTPKRVLEQFAEYKDGVGGPTGDFISAWIEDGEQAWDDSGMRGNFPKTEARYWISDILRRKGDTKTAGVELSYHLPSLAEEVKKFTALLEATTIPPGTVLHTSAGIDIADFPELILSNHTAGLNPGSLSEKGKYVAEIGKPVREEKLFKAPAGDDDFTAINNARTYIKSLGYNAGSMCQDAPIALSKSRTGTIAKWWNIDRKDYPLIDGLLLSDDFRGGDVLVVLFEDIAGETLLRDPDKAIEEADQESSATKDQLLDAFNSGKITREQLQQQMQKMGKSVQLSNAYSPKKLTSIRYDTVPGQGGEVRKIFSSLGIRVAESGNDYVLLDLTRKVEAGIRVADLKVLESEEQDTELLRGKESFDVRKDPKFANVMVALKLLDGKIIISTDKPAIHAMLFNQVLEEAPELVDQIVETGFYQDGKYFEKRKASSAKKLSIVLWKRTAQKEGDMTLEEVKADTLAALQSMRHRLGNYSARAVITELTSWGFWQGGQFINLATEDNYNKVLDSAIEYAESLPSSAYVEGGQGGDLYDKVYFFVPHTASRKHQGRGFMQTLDIDTNPELHRKVLEILATDPGEYQYLYSVPASNKIILRADEDEIARLGGQVQELYNNIESFRTDPNAPTESTQLSSDTPAPVEAPLSPTTQQPMKADADAAVAVLVKLKFAPATAKQMVALVLKSAPNLPTATLVNEALKLRNKAVPGEQRNYRSPESGDVPLSIS